MLGAEMRTHAAEFQKYALGNGILVNVCNSDTVRLIPSLILKGDEADRLTQLLRQFLSKYD
jgi:acetylornithine/succinyldiaminopimelate/putrescine aminotransferase